MPGRGVFGNATCRRIVRSAHRVQVEGLRFDLQPSDSNPVLVVMGDGEWRIDGGALSTYDGHLGNDACIHHEVDFPLVPRWLNLLCRDLLCC